MRYRLLNFIILLTNVIGLSAQVSFANPQKLIIGGDFNFPPYEYLDANSLPDGYNVELSRAICRQLNVEPEFRLAKWALVVQWLENDEIDLVQGMAFSIERAKKMYFSDAHTQTWRSIFVRKDSSITSSRDILNATIVLQQEDIANDYLKRVKFTGKIVNVPSQEDALKLLDSGKYDACIATYMNGIHILHQDRLKNIKALPERILQREYCFASKDIRLIEAINGALLSLSQSGQLAIIQNKWFGNAIQEEHNDGSFFRLHPWFIPLISLLFVLVICLLFVIRAYRRSKLELQSELNIRQGIQTELNREYNIFVRGPVILYKMQMEPVKLLMISENVDQWGYSAEEMIELGEKFLDLVFSEDKEKFILESPDTQQPEYWVKRFRIVTKTGEIRWVLDYSSSVDSPHSERLHYGYLMDITSQKNLEAQLMESKEKAEASNVAKSHFLANMSHEIRTPLNGITGFLQVLMQMQASPEQREYYEIMFTSGRNLMKIINDILDFSKIESGKLDLIQNIFNPRMLIEETVKPFVLHNKKPELQIRYQLNANIPNVLFGDQLRLKQVVINLLQNAVKFTESGLVEIAVDVYTMNEKDVRLLFRISDTGIGIDPRKQEDIFDNFSQANSLITGKYGGTGLGLSIVKRLVELMNGFIWVESEQGKGSSFFFILPFELRTEDAERLPDSPRPAELKLANLTRMEVLLVEDEPINQVVTRRQLEGWDITVTVAANGQKALELCKEHHYHAILMDIQMPVMDGITATQTLRLNEIKTGLHTPIIAFTAAALVGDRERFLDCGMDDYIAKPIDMAQLHSILVKYAPNKSDSRR